VATAVAVAVAVEGEVGADLVVAAEVEVGALVAEEMALI